MQYFHVIIFDTITFQSTETPDNASAIRHYVSWQCYDPAIPNCTLLTFEYRVLFFILCTNVSVLWSVNTTTGCTYEYKYTSGEFLVKICRRKKWRDHEYGFNLFKGLLTCFIPIEFRVLTQETGQGVCNSGKRWTKFSILTCLSQESHKFLTWRCRKIYTGINLGKNWFNMTIGNDMAEVFNKRAS